MSTVLYALGRWSYRHPWRVLVSWVLLLALAVQVGLGISNVVFHLPLLVAVAHNAGGAALLLVMVLINYRLRAVSAETREASGLAGRRTTLVSNGLVQGR